MHRSSKCIVLGKANSFLAFPVALTSLYSNINTQSNISPPRFCTKKADPRDAKEFPKGMQFISGTCGVKSQSSHYILNPYRKNK